MMNKPLILLFGLLISLNAFADNPWDSLTVVAESGLSFRTNPSINSEIILTIPFGIKIRRNWDGGVKDTINGIIDEWCSVEYNGRTGFVWGAYLSIHRFVTQDSYNTDYRIIQEGLACGEIGYSPNLNWYGIYNIPKKNKNELRKIEVQLFLPKLLSEKEIEELFVNKPYEKDGHIYLIKTNQEEKALFIIGSKNELKTGEIIGKTYPDIRDFSKTDSSFIFPEQTRIFTIDSNYWITIKAQDLPYIKDSATFQVENKYTLFACEGISPNPLYFDYNNNTNVLTDMLMFQGYSPQIHASKKNPRIFWVGDIDGDNKPDFVYKSNNMVEHGGYSWSYTLFLSSGKSDNQVLKKVAEIMYGGCNG